MAKPPKKKPDLAETEKSVRRISAGLGWVRDLPDPRDRIYSAPLEVLKALPDHTEIEPEFPIYDQGRIGSCTANALAGAVQFDRKKNKQSPDFIPSRLFIYLMNGRSRDILPMMPAHSFATASRHCKNLASVLTAIGHTTTRRHLTKVGRFLRIRSQQQSPIWPAIRMRANTSLPTISG
jgi:hypothetical protein